MGAVEQAAALKALIDGAQQKSEKAQPNGYCDLDATGKVPAARIPGGSGGGNTILYGAGAPSDELGNDGDFYIDTTDHDIYGPKAGGTWPAGTSLIGPAGTNGTNGTNGVDGNTVLYGAGAPGNGLGVNGNFYIDTTADDIYGPKAGGVWPPGVSLIGPEGDKGDKGDKGDTGDTGPTGPIYWHGPWDSGHGYVVGDGVSYLGSSYICIQANTNENPAGGGGGGYWQVHASKGDTGAQGAAGPTGPVYWHGAWDSGHAYVTGDGVSYLGASYISIQAGTNQTPAPGGTAYWGVLAAKGDTGAQGAQGAQGPAGPAFTSRARAYLNSSNQTILNNTWPPTLVAFNAESYDGSNEFDSTTNRRFTATTAGYYAVMANVMWYGVVDQTRCIALLYVDGAEVARDEIMPSLTGATNYLSNRIHDIIYLAANSYVDVRVYHTAGASKALAAGSNYTWISVHRLS